MSQYDVVVIGAGLGGLTAGAILARAGRKVFVIERSNSVGGAASSYKVGDLFVEGSLHETSDPNDPRDPKHDPLTRAGVRDKLGWTPAGSLYEVRGGPVREPLTVPDDFNGARAALTARFPHARDGIDSLLSDMERIAIAFGTLSRGSAALANPLDAIGALAKLLPAARDWTLSLDDKLTRVFGDDEAVKCAVAANLSYYHDDPKTLWWVFFAMAQGSLLLSGARYVNGGSQRLSSALARVIKTSGGEVVVRRVASAITADAQGRVSHVTHTAKDGSDPQTVAARRVISNAAPSATESLLPQALAAKLNSDGAGRTPSISLFMLTLGLNAPPREFGVTRYSTQLLPDWMTRLADFSRGAGLLAGEPDGRVPPLAIVDYAAIESGVPSPPYVLSIVGPDRLDNWSVLGREVYHARRERWKEAIIAAVDRVYPGLAAAVTASSFNTAASVEQYLGAPHGAVYGYAPTPPPSLLGAAQRSPRTSAPGLYLSSAYAGFGGYTGVIQAAAACADMILAET